MTVGGVGGDERGGSRRASPVRLFVMGRDNDGHVCDVVVGFFDFGSTKGLGSPVTLLVLVCPFERLLSRLGLTRLW